jgi:hypothetical protein
MIAGFLAAPAHGQVGGGQPDRLDFGVVYVGSRVEGSSRIVLDPSDVDSSKLHLDTPAFARVELIDLSTQHLPNGNERSACDLRAVLDTRKPGEFAGSIVATLSQGTAREWKVEIPVKASVRPRRPGLFRVLVVETPFHRYAAGDGAIFDPWRKLVAEGDLDVDCVEHRRGQPVLEGSNLAEFDVVLLGGSGLFFLEEGEIARLRKFAEQGGRVIVCANAFMMGSVKQANKLLVPYGLHQLDQEPRSSAQITTGEFAPCSMTEGIRNLWFHRASPIEIRDPDTTTSLVPSLEDKTQSLLAIAVAGEGEVVALSQSLWWSWVSRNDNATLMRNLLRKHSRR